MPNTTITVRVQLEGSGIPGDRYRVALPTYEMLDVDFAAGVALVRVPIDDVPPALRDGLDVLTAQELRPLQATERAAWGKHLDGRYAERAGEFKPEAV